MLNILQYLSLIAAFIVPWMIGSIVKFAKLGDKKKAVSYTHLDVYKRQNHTPPLDSDRTEFFAGYLAAHPEILEEIPICAIKISGSGFKSLDVYKRQE